MRPDSNTLKNRHNKNLSTSIYTLYDILV